MKKAVAMIALLAFVAAQTAVLAQEVKPEVKKEMKSKKDEMKAKADEAVEKIEKKELTIPSRF